jgi:addiction module HigA family antidote
MAMEMFNPPHPGEIVREDCMVPSGLSVTEAAMRLGVSRQTVSELINGRNGISADMALKLEKAGWGDALSWLRNQASYDLWQARHREETPNPEEARASRMRFSVRLKAHRKTTQPKSAAVKAAQKPKTVAERKAAARKGALKKARDGAAKRATRATRRA